jgi:hypothetical protein
MQDYKHYTTIHDSLRRLQRNPDAAPIYMVEVFTKRGVSSKEIHL